MLVSANNKVSSKNQISPNLSLIENFILTISYIIKAKLSILYMPVVVGLIKRPNLAANAEVIILTLLPKLTKALTFPAWLFLN